MADDLQPPELTSWTTDRTIYVLALDDDHFTIYKVYKPTREIIQLFQQADPANPVAIHEAIQNQTLKATQTHSYSNIKAVNWTESSPDVTADLNESKPFAPNPVTLLTAKSPEHAETYAKRIGRLVNPNNAPTRQRLPFPWGDIWPKMGLCAGLVALPTIGSFLTDDPDSGPFLLTGFARTPLWGILTFDVAVLSLALGLLLVATTKTYQFRISGNERDAPDGNRDWVTPAGWTLLGVSLVCWAVIAYAGYRSFQDIENDDCGGGACVTEEPEPSPTAATETDNSPTTGRNPSAVDEVPDPTNSPTTRPTDCASLDLRPECQVEITFQTIAE